MKKPLTKKQTQVYDFIRDFLVAHHFSPTMEEIAESFEVSPVTIYEHVKHLERKGYIRSEARQARSIELIDDERWPRFPVLGRIAAGLPIEAVDVEENFDFEGFFPQDRDCFVLEVRGHSMIEEHIQNGDFVIVERRNQAYMGETVVALIDDGSVTLKKYYPEKDRVRLEPANSSMDPIYVDNGHLTIQGIVIGVIRRM